MRKKSIWIFAAMVFPMLACVLATSPMAEAAYPDRPIRLIIPFPPGGNTDIIARSLGNELAKNLGVAVVIENRGGAGGMLGSEVVARSTADGYTLMMVSASHVINPSMQKRIPYDTINDFAGISMVADSCVHPRDARQTSIARTGASVVGFCDCTMASLCR